MKYKVTFIDGEGAVRSEVFETALAVQAMKAIIIKNYWTLLSVENIK